MRVFAGPNGSGKTTIINSLKSTLNFGIYVNADDIESSLNLNHRLSFKSFKLNITEKQLQTFFRESKFSPIKRHEADLWEKLKVDKNELYVDTTIDSYLSADLADFIRQNLLLNNISFTYETVMSHESKIKILEQARNNGYRVYLYFIATEDPEINISRVNIRVALSGHFVSPAVLESRYYRSLSQLKTAVKLSDRAYIWDNSGSNSNFIAEITNGTDVEIYDTEKVPNWFLKYLMNILE